MARARNIKPGFYKNEELAECNIWARYIYPGLWQLADRHGRLEDRPKRIKGELLPFDEGQAIDKLIQELHDRKFILRYEVDGKRYIQVLKFKKHQNPHHKEKPANYPEPPAHLLKSLGLVITDNGYEPGMPDLFNSVEAQGYTGSSPGPAVRIPESGSLNPDSLNPESPHRTPDSGQVAASLQPEAALWDRYSKAYFSRYQVLPTRNAKVNSQLQLFLKRVPVAEAPDIAEFYVSHNKAFYVEKGHAVGPMVSDAEWLRTQWQRKTAVTSTDARQVDQTASRGAQAQRMIARKNAGAA